MKRIIAVLVVSLSLSANAWEVEASVGQTHFSRSVNGVWWEKGWWNEWNTKSNSAYIGATDYVNYESRWFSRLRWRAGFQYLGQVSSRALVTNDGEYNGHNGCVSTGCTSMVNMRTEGSVRGFTAALAPEWYVGNGYRVFVEAGLFAYVPKIDVYFSDVTTPNDENHYSYKGGINFGPTLGIGISNKNMDVVLTAYKLDATNDKPQCDKCIVVPNWGSNFGDTVNLSVRFRF